MASNDKPNSPVLNLNDDVLAIIFSILADVCPPCRKHQSPLNRLGWITVVHVCHAWRKVGLAHAKLWADILGAVSFAELYVQDAPVILDLRTPGHESDEMRAQFAEKYLHRARILRDHGVGTDGFDAHHELPGRFLPILRCLELTDGPSSPEDSEDVSEKSLSDEDPINAPALTHAVLTKFIPMHAPNLRVLKAHASWKVDILDVITCLGKYERLEQLHLMLTLAEPLGATPGAQTRLHLPLLRSFMNVSDDLSIAYLLQYITFPSTTTIEVQLCGDDGGTEQDERNLKLLCRLLQPQLCEASRTELLISYTGITRLVVTSPIRLDDSMEVRNGVELQWDRKLHFGALDAVVNLNQVVSSTTRLFLDTFDDEFTPDAQELSELYTTFSALAAVEVLTVRQSALRICRVLGYKSTADVNQAALFPHLKEVFIDSGTKTELYAADTDYGFKAGFKDFCAMLDATPNRNDIRVILTGARLKSDLTHQNIKDLALGVKEVVDERYS